MKKTTCLILVSAVLLAGCRAEPTGSNTAVNGGNEAEPAATVPAIPAIAAPLSRRDLLLAVIAASSDYAAGIDDAGAQRALNGKPFAFRIRYCPGEATESALRSSFDEDTRVRRVEARPDLDKSAAVIGQLGADRYEAVEGFWIRKPWLLEAACPTSTAAPPPAPAGSPSQTSPAAASDATNPGRPAPLVPPTVGIAQFLDDTSARASRRGERPYEFVGKLAEEELPGPVDLQVEGRLRGLAGGKVILCTGEAAAAPPTCIVSVRIDKVGLLAPDGEVLAEWGAS